MKTFAAHGLSPRETFGHRVIAIPKPYPDSQLLLERRGLQRKTIQRGALWQLNVYTTDFYDLPDELFQESEINWHGQQLGLKGLVAAAGLWIFGDTATISVLQSDLCQQLYRHTRLRDSCKTRVETHFKYWYVILLNAILDFCLTHDISVLYCPTGNQVLKNTRKQISPDLFLRIYDHPKVHYRCSRKVLDSVEYWEISLPGNADRVISASSREPVTPARCSGSRICLFHDIEEDIDTSISPLKCKEDLLRILEIERTFGIDATYNIVGIKFRQKRDTIAAFNARHSFGFHSFDHQLEDETQLTRCRAVDLRVRGYRPARSQITPELTDYNLSLQNFEWFASSAGSLERRNCGLQNGIVKIPVHLDDYPLVKGVVSYEQWESKTLQLTQTESVLGLGLHDCYAQAWLEHFPRLLEKLQKEGSFFSADAICNTALLEASETAAIFPVT